MLSFPIVKHLDILEAHIAHLSSRLETLTKDAFVFETVEPAFSRRVVPAVAFAAHRTNHFVFSQQRLKGVARVLASSVRMMNQTGRRSATEPLCVYATSVGFRLHIRFPCRCHRITHED